jgi:Glycosyl hydrolase family 20, catalytic domain
MRLSCIRFCLSMILTAMGSSALAREPAAPDSKDTVWRGVHMISPGRAGIPDLKKGIDKGLKPLGVNVIVLEVNYGFKFKSHPELSDQSGLSREDARDLAAFCRERGIRLIPQLNCLGHQSWAKNTASLLKTYPQFDETPKVPADNQGIYCRSWCPLNPEVNSVVFALIDELADAFDADAFHVGMDEVFLVASDQCPRCRGKNPAELFAKAVNDLHTHIVKDRKLTMLMWGDRLLDDKTMGYGEWESSKNGTAPAIDKIPTDIILCDWHYELRDHYPSVAYFQQKGFRVWPSSWNNPEAALAFLEEGRRVNKGLVIGHLGTTWLSATAFCKALLEPGGELPKGRRAGVQGAAQALRVCMNAMTAR